MKAYINKAKCASEKSMCKPLVECPEKAIVWIEDDKEALGSRTVIDEEKCSGCGICVPLCCGYCIELK